MIASEVKRRFGADIGDERTRLLDSIRQDISVGRAAGVQSTPTVFVNGKLATDGSGGQLSPAYADLAIQLELRRLDRQ